VRLTFQAGGVAARPFPGLSTLAGSPSVYSTAEAPAVSMLNPLPEIVHHFPRKWLRVSNTAERSQVDQRVPQKLHPIVPLLDAFKAEQQALELVFPRKGALNAQA
jgi:hypothetical protein